MTSAGEMAVSIGTLNDYPLITVAGKVSPWQSKTIEDIVDGYVMESTAVITIDTTEAVFADVESVSTFIRTLRMGCVETQVIVIAGGRTAAILKTAGLEPNVYILQSIDQAVESVPIPASEFLSSRRMALKTLESDLPEIDDLPLAA